MYASQSSLPDMKIVPLKSKSSQLLWVSERESKRARERMGGGGEEGRERGSKGEREGGSEGVRDMIHALSFSRQILLKAVIITVCVCMCPVLCVMLGWGVMEVVATRVVPLWVNARGVEFSWDSLLTGFDANVSLVCL